jgi:hypothetical protein
MKIINLTPHEIVYIKADGTKETFPSIGSLRADRVELSREEKDGFIICKYGYLRQDMGEDIERLLIENADDKDCYFIVSKITLEALKGLDVDTSNFLIVGDTVKDDSGKVIGCRSFSRG